MEELVFIIYDIFGLIMTVYGAYFGAVSLCFLLREKKAPEPGKFLRFAVLVAARNEESCIAGIVESIKEQAYPGHLVDVYVIPNNCTDNTAAAAGAAGARILEVSSRVKNKGQALQEAFRRLMEQESHEAYCVFDADNEAGLEFLAEMNRALQSGARAAKSRILAKNPHEGWICGCYETYFCNANVFLNLARHKLGLSARLIGTGFAVRRELMEELGGWRCTGLTEDAEFYALLSARGEKIAFVPGAVTYDEQPLSFRESIIQRRRWMSGVMGVGRRSAGKLLARVGKGPGRGFALDALVQLSFACVQALILPVFFLFLCADPAAALESLPGLAAEFYAGTLLVGGASLILERRMTGRTAGTLLLYPLFIFSFLPLQTLSLFLPNKTWRHIRHTGVRRSGAKAAAPR